MAGLETGASTTMALVESRKSNCVLLARGRDNCLSKGRFLTMMIDVRTCFARERQCYVFLPAYTRKRREEGASKGVNYIIEQKEGIFKTTFIHRYKWALHSPLCTSYWNLCVLCTMLCRQSKRRIIFENLNFKFKWSKNSKEIL